MISYSIKGGKELDALLKQLPVEVETKILRNGLAVGANLIRDEARALATKKSGEMAKAVKTSRGTQRSEGYVAAKVSLKGRHAFLGVMIEYGVLPHLIWARSATESLVINGVRVGKQVQHPGFAAKPFFRPAIDAQAGAAVQAVGDYLTRFLKWGTITAPTIAVDLEEAA